MLGKQQDEKYTIKIVYREILWSEGAKFQKSRCSENDRGRIIMQRNELWTANSSCARTHAHTQTHKQTNKQT